MGLKKNFIYNTALLVSQYIFPLIIFPYITRVFGVDKIGLVNFADSVVNYFILFSTLGLMLTGIREVAKNKNEPEKLNKVFSELIVLHIVLTVIVLVIYLGCIFVYDKFYDNLTLYLIGASKLIFNIFLIEWFFRGMENFKFITVRTIFIKILYTISLFIFVTTKEDYNIYFALTCGMTVINGIVNFWYARNYIAFKFKGLEFKKYYKPVFTIGVYMILTSMYTTFNVAYLGIASTDTAVGYYTTSLKIYTIILGLFSALNMVMVPRLSSLLSEDNSEAFNKLIGKSVSFVSMLCFPIIMCGIMLAPQVINIIAGKGYDGAILCFRIIIPLIFIVGIAQILSNQILVSLSKEKELAITSFVGAAVGVFLNIILVPLFKEVGTSIVVVVSEMIVTCILYFYCARFTTFRLPLTNIFYNLLASIPYLAICYLSILFFNNSVIILLVTSVFSLIYFMVSQLYILKNEVVVSEFNKILNLVSKPR